MPGPVGAPRTIIAHGGEEVSSGQAVVENHITFRPGTEWLRDYIQVETKKTMRREARGGNRPLPSRAGGLT